MVFYVVVVTFVMTLLMNKFINDVILPYFLFIQSWKILHPNISIKKNCHGHG